MRVSVEGKYVVTFNDGVTKVFDFQNERALSAAKRNIRALVAVHDRGSIGKSNLENQALLDAAVHQYLESGAVIFTKSRHDVVFGRDLSKDFEKWAAENTRLPVSGGRNRLYSAIDGMAGVVRARNNNLTSFRYCKLASCVGDEADSLI